MSNVVDIEQYRHKKALDITDEDLVVRMMVEREYQARGFCGDCGDGDPWTGPRYPCNQPPGHKGVHRDREGWTW